MARTKGSPNRRCFIAADKARELGIDPLEILLLFAKGDWKALGYDSPTIARILPGGGVAQVPIITPDIRVQAASSAVPYLHPKRKESEMLPGEEDPIVDQGKVQKVLSLVTLKEVEPSKGETENALASTG